MDAHGSRQAKNWLLMLSSLVLIDDAIGVLMQVGTDRVDRGKHHSV